MARIQFEVSEDKLREIDQLRDDMGVSTRTELFNYALTLLKWALREEQLGRVVASLDESTGKYKQLEIPRVNRLIGKRAV
jgi:hypothetical protein